MDTDKEILDLLLDLSEGAHRLAKIVASLTDRVEALEANCVRTHAPEQIEKEGLSLKSNERLDVAMELHRNGMSLRKAAKATVTDQSSITRRKQKERAKKEETNDNE